MIKHRADRQPYYRYVVGVVSLVFFSEIYACPGLVFSDAWIREPPPVATVAAGYLSISNETDKDLVVDRVESDCCGHIMAHETVVEDSRTKMKHLAKLVIPAKKSIKLEPLGKHLMLMQLRHIFSEGNDVVVRFHCDGETSAIVNMPIVKQ